MWRMELFLFLVRRSCLFIKCNSLVPECLYCLRGIKGLIVILFIYNINLLITRLMKDFVLVTVLALLLLIAVPANGVLNVNVDQNY